MSLPGLTSPRRPPVPHSASVVLSYIRDGGEFVSVETLLYFEILFNVDESLLHTLLWSQLEDLEISRFGVALNIFPSRLDSELPGSFDPGVLFKTVVTRSVVALDRGEMSPSVMFLELGEADGVFIV